jgi:tetratricopeptide (TPR) repeat protein
MTLACMLACQISFSQINVEINKKDFKTEAKDGYKEAINSIALGDEYFSSYSTGGYLRALPEYLSANKYNSNNAELNYKIGVCYLSSTEKKKAITFLEKASSLKSDVSPDIKYELGRAYQVNYMFEEAINAYNDFNNNKAEIEVQLKKQFGMKIDEFNADARI